MIKKLAAAGALLACLAPAQAEQQQYSWSFSGFTDMYTGSWEIPTVLNGFFTVDDLNADGKFDRSEVSSLIYKDHEYTSCTGCRITQFSWVPGSSPIFNIQLYETYDWGFLSEHVTVGSSFGYAYFGNSGEPAEFGGRWTDKTVSVVTAVPEPQTWLMLGAGLLAVGGLARRRAKTLVGCDKL